MIQRRYEKMTPDVKKKKPYESDPPCPGLFPCQRSSTGPLALSVMFFFPNKEAQQGATAGSCTQTSWRIIIQLPSSTHPPSSLTWHEHQTPGSGGRVGLLSILMDEVSSSVSCVVILNRKTLQACMSFKHFLHCFP